MSGALPCGSFDAMLGLCFVVLMHFVGGCLKYACDGMKWPRGASHRIANCNTTALMGLGLWSWSKRCLVHLEPATRTWPAINVSTPHICPTRSILPCFRQGFVLQGQPHLPPGQPILPRLGSQALFHDCALSPRDENQPVNPGQSKNILTWTPTIIQKIIVGVQGCLVQSC